MSCSADLPRLDFIKCDVEGLELSVFNLFVEIIGKFRPVILCELEDPRKRETLLGFAFSFFLCTVLPGK